MSTPSTTAGSQTRERRRVLASAAIGQFVEWYDFTVYAYLAGTLAVLFFPTADPAAALLSTFAVYAVGFVMRPAGGLLFGHLGDKLGRRGVLAAIILLMGASTAAIGLLPTYEQIGLIAPLLLVLFKMVQGLSAGGEAMGSNALVSEHAPAHRRGLWVGFGYSFATIPAVFAALLVLLLTTVLPESVFTAWGWRIPFLLGGVISLIGLYIRHRVQESPAYEQTKAAQRVTKRPISEVLREHRKPLGFCFAMATLSGLGFYTLAGYFATYLSESVGLSSTNSLVSNSVALFLAFVAMSVGGLLSDKVGRRRVLMLGAALSAVLAIPAYIIAGMGSLLTAIIGQGMLAIALGIFFGVVGIVFLELFPTRARYTGSAIGYNGAYVLFGGTAPLLSTWLIATTGSLIAPAIYMAVLAACVLAVTVIMPETFKDSLVRREDTGTDQNLATGLAAHQSSAQEGPR